jgi:cell wall assembly regulator SMI1
VEEGGGATARTAWQRFVARCDVIAPVTAAALHGAADDFALANLMQEMGYTWTDALVAWLGVSDGADRTFAGAVIPPCFIPAPVARIRETWHLMTGISSDTGDPAELVILEAGKAGTSSPYFLRAWVPIADDTSGNLLFVDLRPGEMHGSVCQWWRDDGFHEHPLWPGVARMAEDIAGALDGGRWAPDETGERDMEPAVVDGMLRWEDTDTWETTRGSEPNP